MSGLRFNNGKLRWGLMSWPALREVVKVLEFGANKYASWNWTKGLSWSQCFDSLQRHLLAWYEGEDRDPETGLSHMAHVVCNAMFLMHFILFKTGTDDRPKELRGDNLNDERNESSPSSTDRKLEAVRDAVVQRGLFDHEADLRPQEGTTGL